MTGLGEVTRAAAPVCAAGTDAAALAAVLTWSCGPRRSLDALRRRVRDAPTGGADAADGADAPDAPDAADGAVSARVAAAARADGGLDGPLAEVALRVLSIWRTLGVRVALVGDPAYPTVLADGWPDLDAPVLLAWRGEPPASAGPGVALVGARNASAYGLGVAELLASAVARAGGRVVSGGAVGIDAAAHTAALGLPGGTTVVLGCGHAVAYPVAHARPGGLFARVLDDGGTLVSELLPEVPAHPGVIRARNRVLAGLAVVTVVVEGGRRSGALLTAGAAAERGREVLAVPGDIQAPGSAAPLRLLTEGARICTGPDDVLALLPLTPVSRSADGGRGTPGPPGAGPSTRVLLPPPVLGLLERAGPRGIAVEELALAHTGGAAALLAGLTRARLAGLIEDVPGGVRLRSTRPSDR
jgi:DNA processing protein